MPDLQSFHLRAAAAIAQTYLGFVALMTDGFALAPHSAATMAGLLLALLVALGVVLAGLWALSLGRRARMDEREAAIDLIADRAGYRALDAAVFVLTVLVLMGTHDGNPVLAGPQAQVLAFVTLTTIGGLARCLTAFRHERRL